MSNVSLEGKTVLVTGAAGFIGSNLVKRLYKDLKDVTVIGIDNMNDYYDVRLKEARLEGLAAHPSFTFVKGSIADTLRHTRSLFPCSLEMCRLPMQTPVRWKETLDSKRVPV